MDNIGKLVLGLVAFVGLIVLLIPQGNPLEDKSAPVAEAPKNAPPPGNGDDGEDDGGSNEPGDAGAPKPVLPATSNDAIAFGQPMMDPTPPGQKALQDPQQQQAQVQQQTGGTPVDDETNSSGPAPGIPDSGPGVRN